MCFEATATQRLKGELVSGRLLIVLFLDAYSKWIELCTLCFEATAEGAQLEGKRTVKLSDRCHAPADAG
jgi:hypothetical protein